MSKLNAEIADSICNALRSGTVPESGLEHYAVGLDRQMAEIEHQLEAVIRGKSRFKFVRGAYGSGKTFLCSLAAARAGELGFVTSKVVISKGITPLYRLDEVYKKICSGLRTQGRPGLEPLLMNWISHLEEELLEIDGLAEDDPNFQDALDTKIDSHLRSVGDEAGRFAAGVKTYYRFFMEEDRDNARAILDWLSGDSHVSHSVKKLAGIKGDLERQDVFGFLSAVLEIVRQSDNKGLFLVLDEVETVLKENKPEIRKGLEVLRQLVDALSKDEFPRMYLMVTGTPGFFEDEKGMPLEPALNERICVEFRDNEPDNLRQPQIRLDSFNESTLRLVAQKVREIYPTKHRNRIEQKIDDQFIDQLVGHFTNAFGGKVSVTPRLFLREFVHQMDLVDQYDDYNPKQSYKFDPESLKKAGMHAEEEESLQGVYL